MRLNKLVTLLLAGFLTFGSLNSVAATQNAKKVDKITSSKTLKELPKKSVTNKNVRHGHYQSGEASYYADMFNGRRTANGEIFSNDKMTAAHRSLPFGTLVKVKNMRNGRTAIVRINDRGPYAETHKRVIDLSKTAARKLGIYKTGVANVKLAILSKDKRSDYVVEEDI